MRSATSRAETRAMVVSGASWLPTKMTVSIDA